MGEGDSPNMWSHALKGGNNGIKMGEHRRLKFCIQLHKLSDCLHTTLIVLAASQHGCIINITDCMYSELLPEDGQFVYSKHAEDITGINLERKYIWLVLITQIYHDAWSI